MKTGDELGADFRIKVTQNNAPVNTARGEAKEIFMKKLFQTKVGRNGIKFNGVYYHPALRQYNKENVLVVTKRNNLYVDVFTMNGEYICKAEIDYFNETPANKQKCLSCPYFSQKIDKTYVGSDSPISPEEALARFSALSKSS
ncbi:MAG: Mu transposase C-terminal domain-containing protein [Treponema sp.]|nr:Mu transposase C-terminal domain-containing protein [Treponema sp.]